MKAVMISIKPKWCELIRNGRKTIEVRKTKPKIETPFQCYIYCTNTKPFLVLGNVFNGKIIGEFECDKIDVYDDDTIHSFSNKNYYCICNDFEELKNYAKGKRLYGWHISDLVIYDEPKKLEDFRKPCNKDYNCFLCDKSGFAPNLHIECFNTFTRPPQSWCYVDELYGG